MRILITGGAGFIGSNLARLAVAEGHEVRIIDDLSTGYLANISDLTQVEFIEGSILDQALVTKVMAGIDSVTHLAALGSVPRSIATPLSTNEVNVLGTLRILEAARSERVGHCVVASSSSVYGTNPALPKTESEWVRPMSPYGVSKLAAEQYALAYQESYGLHTLAFRFFNVYGPYQRAKHAYAAVIPIFIDAMLKGVSLPMNGDGNQSRDFTYVGTVCRILLDAGVSRAWHSGPVNLAFGSNISLNDLVIKLEKIAGRPLEVARRPKRDGDVMHSQAANARLTALFPDVVPVSLDRGLAETVKWHREGA